MTPAVVELISQLKTAVSDMRMPVKNADGDVLGFLLPLTHERANAPEVLWDIYNWRESTMHLFLSVYRNTPERLRLWLKDVVLPDHGRQPFLITTSELIRVGICGVTSATATTAELDTMIRGKPIGPPTLMKYAQATLMHWIFGSMGVKRITGRVLSSNVLVRRFHRSFGFTEERSVPLRREEQDNGYRLVEDPSAVIGQNGLSLVHIAATRDSFYGIFPWLVGQGFPAGFSPQESNGSQKSKLSI